MRDLTSRANRRGTLIAYVIMVGAGVALFFWIWSLGSGLTAPPPAAAHATGTGRGVLGSDILLHLLLALVVVILAARGLGAVFRALHQPPVMGEIVAGILLGPSLLGRIAPDLAAYLLPAAIIPAFGLLSQVGIILFMFLVGLELDTGVIRRRADATLVISHASIVAPFLLGSSLALWLYPTLSSSDVPFLVFTMFMGVSMSVTAFPVLARILTDRGLQKTPLGMMAISCAAVDDVTAWCLLALVVGVAQAEVGSAVITVVASLAYVAAMLFAVGPLVARWVESGGRKRSATPSAITAMLVLLLLSALATEAIGVHAVFGAFLLGAVVPHDSTLARDLDLRLHDLVTVVLLPAFFAFTGMRTEVGLVSGLWDWGVCLAIITVAAAGKFGASTIAARASGIAWREAAQLGVLMNTRGLMELIVLNIGLDLGVISPKLFTMLVVMALATTFAAAPLLSALSAREAVDGRDAAAA